MASFSHRVEDLLSLIKSGKLQVTAEVTSLLLRCNDRLKAILTALRSEQPSPAIEDIEAELIRATSDRSLFSSNGAPAPDQGFSKSSKPIVSTPAAHTAPAAKPAQPSSPLGASVATRAAEDHVKISLRKIDDLLNYFGEQVILQSSLDMAKNDLLNHAEQVVKTITQLSKITYDLQQTVVSLRMVSLRKVFSKLERTARDAAMVLQKNVLFECTGQDHELDKAIVESLGDPLIHMVRNSIDHGVESPEERVAAGKPAQGRVEIRAIRRGGFFYIEIEDDGRGLSRQKILAKAIAAGLVPPDSKLSDDQIYRLIFQNGFSTKDTVSEMSGRGVGMDVVLTAITRMKGLITIESTEGKGTLFRIRLPLTLAIFNGLLVKIGGQPFVIPNSDVEEVVAITGEQVTDVSPEEKVVRIRDRVYTLVDVKRDLQIEIPADAPARRMKSDTVVLARFGSDTYALQVDEVLNQQRVVHKNLGPEVRTFQGAAGATILGDGSVAFILELSSILDSHWKAA